MNSGNLNFAYCIIFLRNAGERLRAARLTMDVIGCSATEAIQWVDTVRMDRFKVDMEAARKMLAEYPTHTISAEDFADRIEYRVSHWPDCNQ